MKLDSSVSAIITGGASGLGAATARRLAAAGVKVALFDLNVAAGEALAAELGGVFCAVDVTQEDSVDAGFVKARAAIGQERILVNCAGTGNAIKTASRRAVAAPKPDAPPVMMAETVESSFMCSTPADSDEPHAIRGPQRPPSSKSTNLVAAGPDAILIPALLPYENDLF